MKELSEIIELERHKIFRRSAHVERANPSFIPIHITGGIGDMIISIESLERLANIYSIMVYTKHIEAFRYFNKNIPVQEKLPYYTWHLEWDIPARFIFSNTFTKFLIKEHEELYLRQQQLFEKDPYLGNLVRDHKMKYHLISRHGRDRGWSRRTFTMGCLGYE